MLVTLGSAACRGRQSGKFFSMKEINVMHLENYSRT